MGATLLSKLLGMARSILFSGPYGTGDAATAFTTASRIPLSFFDMLFSAAILGCFIPVYNSFSRDREKEADEFACIFLNAILLLTGALAIVGILFADGIVSLIAPALDAEVSALAASLLRIMFPMIIFTGGTYTLVGVMQSKGSFILPAMISTISNIGVVLYLLILNGRLGSNGIYGLAIAYSVSWLIQFATLAIPLARNGFRFRAIFNFRSPEFVKTLKMAPPIMIGSWLAPIGILLGTYFASFLAVPGAISVFDYSYNIYIIIAGTLTYSICNFVFPSLSRLAAEGDEEGFSSTVKKGITTTLFIVIPFMIAVFVLAGEGVSILYQRGEFNKLSAKNTASVLRFMALAMPAFVIIELINRVFYARSKVKIPMLAAIFGVVSNAIVSYILTRHTSVGLASVGIGNAAGQIAAALFLVIALAAKIKRIIDRRLVITVIKILISGAISASSMICVYRLLSNSPFDGNILKNIITCAIVFASGAAIYLAASAVLRIKLTNKEKKEATTIEQ